MANHVHLPCDNDAWQWKAKYPMESKNMLGKGTITVRVKIVKNLEYKGPLSH